MKKLLFIISISGILMFTSIYCYFNSIAPEGMSILTHYVFGSGDDLILKSDYLPNSPVIKKKLKQMKVGETRRITFKQSEDWRLSYALNPFVLTKEKNGFKITQYIAFSKNNNIYTDVNIFNKKIRITDNWINYLGTTPYTVRYEYLN